ncbi:MAG: hypothetical protein ACI9DG_002266 [Oleispira sp.]|jgi:hypothetical protein
MILGKKRSIHRVNTAKGGAIIIKIIAKFDAKTNSFFSENVTLYSGLKCIPHPSF